MTTRRRTVRSILVTLPVGLGLVALLLPGCQTSLGATSTSGNVDLGARGDDDIYWCCDPDRIPCECPSLWHCTEGAGGKRCSQQHPAMPDDGSAGSWTCSYGEGDAIVCRGDAGQHPDAGSNGEW